MNSIIYKLTHTPTGKFYIGSLKDCSKFDTYKSSSRIVSKMITDNPSDWNREILKVFENVEFNHVVREEHEIIQSYVLSLGWNALWNRAVYTGFHLCYSPEAYKKHAEAMKSETVRKALSEATKRQMLDPKMKKAIAKANSERKHSDETRRKLSEAHKGKKHSPETMIKMREILKKAREKMAEIRNSATRD